MDRGAWRATVHGVTRVGHDLEMKPPLLLIYTVVLVSDIEPRDFITYIHVSVLQNLVPYRFSAFWLRSSVESCPIKVIREY